MARTAATSRETELELQAMQKEVPSVEKTQALAFKYDYEPLDVDLVAMASAPFDGSIVIISDDETKPGRPAKWHCTRRINPKAYPMLQKIAYWADPVTRAQIKMDVICWRKPEWQEVPV